MQSKHKKIVNIADQNPSDYSFLEKDVDKQDCEIKKKQFYTKPSKPIIRLTIFKSAQQTRFIRQDVPQNMSLKILSLK